MTYNLLTYHLRHIDGHHKPIKQRFVSTEVLMVTVALSPTYDVVVRINLLQLFQNTVV